MKAATPHRHLGSQLIPGMHGIATPHLKGQSGIEVEIPHQNRCRTTGEGQHSTALSQLCGKVDSWSGSQHCEGTRRAVNGPPGYSSLPRAKQLPAQLRLSAEVGNSQVLGPQGTDMHTFTFTTPKAWVLPKPGTLNFPQHSVMVLVTPTLVMVAHACNPSTQEADVGLLRV